MARLIPGPSTRNPGTDVGAAGGGVASALSRREGGAGTAKPRTPRERDFFIDNRPVRIHFIIEMIWWTSLAPWQLELPFPGSLISTFLARTPKPYRVTSLVRRRTPLQGVFAHKKLPPLGPYSRPVPRVLGGSKGVERFVMSEVPLHRVTSLVRRRTPLGPCKRPSGGSRGGQGARCTGVPRS